MAQVFLHAERITFHGSPGASGSADGRRFWELVRLSQRDGRTRVEAIRHVVRTSPEAHEAYVRGLTAAAAGAKPADPEERADRRAPTGDFNTEVARLMAKEDMSRGEAIRAVVDRYPELHEAWVNGLKAAGRPK